jgi:hypothetical protein
LNRRVWLLCAPRLSRSRFLAVTKEGTDICKMSAHEHQEFVSVL